MRVTEFRVGTYETPEQRRTPKTPMIVRTKEDSRDVVDADHDYAVSDTGEDL